MDIPRFSSFPNRVLIIKIVNNIANNDLPGNISPFSRPAKLAHLREVDRWLTDCASGDSGIGKILCLKSGLSEQWIDCVENLKKERRQKKSRRWADFWNGCDLRDYRGIENIAKFIPLGFVSSWVSFCPWNHRKTGQFRRDWSLCPMMESLLSEFYQFVWRVKKWRI
jgi:hypothetical protein